MVDLNILNKIPVLDINVILEIEPLAPLSMVSDLPGSYYKTLKSPSKKMLCGLFENILEWHIDAADRKQIVDDLRKIRKKQKLQFPETRGSTYMPLLTEYFEVKLVVVPELIHYDDYWSKAYRRQDAIVHAKGTFNISHELIAEKRQLPRSEKKPSQVDDKALEKFFKDNLDKYPVYYSSPTGREYISTNDIYKIKLSIDTRLYSMLKNQLAQNNLGSLGNSEGWINLKIDEL
jgi:CRISPR-associated protein Cas5